MVYMTVYPAFFRSAALIIKRFWMRVRSIWQFLVTELLRVRATFFDHQRDGLAPAFGSTSGIQRALLATDHSAAGVPHLSCSISLAIRIERPKLTAILPGVLTMFSTYEEDGFT